MTNYRSLTWTRRHGAKVTWLVTTLIDDNLGAGRFEQRWSGLDQSGRHVAAGVYFYRLNVGSWSQTKRIVKLR